MHSFSFDALISLIVAGFRVIKLNDSIKCNNYDHMAPQNLDVTLEHHGNLPGFISVSCNSIILFCFENTLTDQSMYTFWGTFIHTHTLYIYIIYIYIYIYIPLDKNIRPLSS